MTRELSSSSELEKLFQELSREIGQLEETVSELEPALRQSRLADLSVHLAIYFFSERSMQQFCERVLDELIQETGAATGAFALFGRDGSEAQIVAGRNARGESLPPEELRVSRTILNEIQGGRASVLIADAFSDDRLGDEASVRELVLRSVLAIPLRVEDYLAGAIHLENNSVPGAFDEQDLELLQEVGRLVTVYLSSAFRLKDEVAARRRIYSELKGKTFFDGLVGTSARLFEILELVKQAGPSEATVVIEGESGTGKELVARAIHKSSGRSDRPLVVVNCAAIPDALLESELFGHERGAFTGAYSRQIGRLEQANGSTAFLDEIGELSLPVQAKLLRFLQNREIERLGGTKAVRVDVRLIAATSRDIQTMVKEGTFREDLFYRLYVIPVKVPPLRERLEDIPLLVDHFVQIFSFQACRECPEIDPEIFEILQEYDWPGNIRELENLIQRMIVLCRGGRLRVQDLPPNILQDRRRKLDLDKNPFSRYLASLPTSWSELKRRRQQMLNLASEHAQALENRFLDDLLKRAGGNISRAAEMSGIHRTLLHRKLRVRNL